MRRLLLLGWMVVPLVPLLLVGCGGPVEETLVDELRVVAAIPSTPEARPGEAVDISVTVVEPAGAPVDVMVWLCTASGPPGSPCAESAGALAGVATVQREVVGDVSATVEVPALLAAALSEQVPELPASLWVLACEPGLCPIMDAVEADPAPGSDAHAELFERLADPVSELAELPLQGVAASRRTLRVSTRDDALRNKNPRVVGVLGVDRVEVAAEVGFFLNVEDDQPLGTAYGYATAGGFGAVEVPVVDGRVDLTWFAPEEAPDGRVDLLVVVQDGVGGEGLWRGSVRVDTAP